MNFLNGKQSLVGFSSPFRSFSHLNILKKKFQEVYFNKLYKIPKLNAMFAGLSSSILLKGFKNFEKIYQVW